MSIKSNPIADEVAAEYLRPGDPALADYYPAWLDNLADDVTVEGSMLDGAVQGADAVRSIVVGIRELYGDSQEFHFAAPAATTAGSRTTSLGLRATPSDVSIWSPGTRPGKPSTSSRVTGHAARCCSSPAYWGRSSLVPRSAGSSPRARAEA